MKRFTVTALAGLALLTAAPLVNVSEACLWDYDTLQEERSRFPGALELMTGKFRRHSPAFYRWRIADRLQKLDSATGEDKLRIYDDLVVAFDKLRDHDKAVETARTVLELDADRYESHSNLGTVLIHAGQFEDGLKHLNRALEINPDAHFGRERWQKYLVEWVLKRKAELAAGSPHPTLLGDTNFSHGSKSAFVEFLTTRVKDEENRAFSSAEALKGVLGMMRFGHHDHPVLLEAAAILLMNPDQRGLEHDSRLLATRALLLAAQRSADNQKAAAVFLARAKQVISLHDGLKVEVVQRALQIECTEGELYFAQIAADELAWISEGGDVDAKYSAKYYADPTTEGIGDQGHSGPEADGQGPAERHAEERQQLADEVQRLQQQLQRLNESFQRDFPDAAAGRPSDGEDDRDARNSDDSPRRRNSPQRQDVPSQDEGSSEKLKESQAADSASAGPGPGGFNVQSPRGAVARDGASAAGSMATPTPPNRSALVAPATSASADPVASDKPTPAETTPGSETDASSTEKPAESKSAGCAGGSGGPGWSWPLALLLAGLLAITRRFR